MQRSHSTISGFHVIDIGYDVYVIWGRAVQRKRLIKELKSNIKNGCRYEFMYTECSTLPMLLTEPNHYPIHLFIDFVFFRYIKKQGTKIGLFYCGIHRKLHIFAAKMWQKEFIKLKCHQFDIVQYEKFVDHFYVPNLIMLDYIGSEKLKKFPGFFCLERKNFR